MTAIKKTSSTKLLPNKATHLFSQLLSTCKSSLKAINTSKLKGNNNVPSENGSSISIENCINNQAIYIADQYREIGVIEYDDELNLYFCGKYLFANKLFVKRLCKCKTPIIVEKYYYNMDPITRGKYPFFSRGFSFVQDYIN